MNETHKQLTQQIRSRSQAKGKKKFIDKKSAVTFQLVHRSQHDPLVTDETAPQHVLVQSEGDAAKKAAVAARTQANSVQQPEGVDGDVDAADKKRAEQKKFGIFFDDDYDYLQHLRGPDAQKPVVHWEYQEPQNLKRGQQAVHAGAAEAVAAVGVGGLVLPSSVFASEFEEAEGMLRKAAPRSGPQLDWDPDIVAALDDDFDYEDPANQLDDDFMDMAGGDIGSDEEYEDEEGDLDSDDLADGGESDFGSEQRDALGPLRMYEDEELKSRFTEYSMSSSVIRRNEQLQLLDERFEKFFEGYDEPEIGALDCEEIEGNVEMGEDLLQQCMVEFKRDEDLETYKKEWDVERIRKLNAGEDEDDETELMEVEPEARRPFDCESILSTYSNIYNHPKLIEDPTRKAKKKVPAAALAKIQINPKTGVPENVFHGENSGLTTKALAKLDASTR